MYANFAVMDAEMDVAPAMSVSAPHSEGETILSALHNILHSLQDSYTTPGSSISLTSPLQPFAPFTAATSGSTPSTLHPFHPGREGYSVISSSTSSVGHAILPKALASHDIGGGKDVQRGGDISKDGILEKLRKVRESLQVLQDTWRTDVDVIINPTAPAPAGGTKNTAPVTGLNSTPVTTGETGSVMTSERKQNALIRIMTDHCASDGALLGMSRTLRDIEISKGFGQALNQSGKQANTVSGRQRRRTPFVAPNTLTSPLMRIVDSAASHMHSHGIDSNVNLQDPDLGMGVEEDTNGDGDVAMDGTRRSAKEHSAVFAGTMLITEIIVGLPEGWVDPDRTASGKDAATGGPFVLNRLAVEVQDPQNPDTPVVNLVRAEQVLQRRFQEYLNVVNEYRASDLAGPDMDSFSSDGESEDGTGQKESFALRAERVYTAFEKEWLDLFALDRRTKDEADAGETGQMEWLRSLQVVESGISRMQDEHIILPPSEPSILPSFQVLPAETPFLNPVFRLLPSNPFLPAPFAQDGKPGKNELARWRLVCDPPLIVSQDFFDQEEESTGHVKRSNEVDGGIALMLGCDFSSAYGKERSTSSRSHRYACNESSIPGYLIGQIGLSSPQDIARFSEAARRTLVLNDLFGQFFQRDNRKLGDDSRQNASHGEEGPLDAELDALLNDESTATPLEISIQRRPRDVALSSQIYPKLPAISSPVGISISLQVEPTTSAAAFAVKASWTSILPMAEGQAEISGKLNDALGDGYLSTSAVENLPAWMDELYTRYSSPLGK